MSNRWSSEQGSYSGGSRKGNNKPSWMTKEWEEKKKLEKANMQLGRFTVDVVKAKLAIRVTSLKSICGKIGIKFTTDKVFNQSEYDDIKRVVVAMRNAGKL